MLTEISIRNFKNLERVQFELADRVVLVGPNNSGKTSALQALALWDIGVKRWVEKRGLKAGPTKRPGVTINRRDLIAVPIPTANLLWRDLHVMEAGNRKIRIEIVVKGISNGAEWECGLEFDYANEESFYCRPLRLDHSASEPGRMEVPEAVKGINVAYLQPMSGLGGTETRLDSGAINVRMGEGRTAEVLRNLCYQIREREGGKKDWRELARTVESLFGVQLLEPVYIAERGEITLAYKQRGTQLDISSSGRGLQQTLLLMAHMMVNQQTVLLLDEPDAHLEILRQRQIYQLLSDTATRYGNQIVAASHSEVILNEAADRDVVIAFLGKPHRIDDRGSQVLKSLKEIGYDQYYQAEATGWVLYLEGSTDLSILKAFAEVLNHHAREALDKPFVHYVLNQPKKAQEHFYGLREAKTDLVGIAIYDKLDNAPPEDPNITQRTWRKREIENYLCEHDVLVSWASSKAEKEHGPLFADSWKTAMEETIGEMESALETLGKPSPWGDDSKVTDDFLDPLFSKFFKKLQLPNLIRKTDYHELARFVTPENLDKEVSQVLDDIVRVARSAKPVEPMMSTTKK